MSADAPNGSDPVVGASQPALRALPKWIRLERSDLRLGVYVLNDYRDVIDLGGGSALALILLPALTVALLAMGYVVGPLVTLLLWWRQAYRSFTAEALGLEMTTLEWRLPPGWLWRRRVAASAIEGVRIVPHRSGWALGPAYAVRVRYRAGGGRTREGYLIRSLPSLRDARTFIAELAEVFARAPSRPVLRVLPMRASGVRLEGGADEVRASWRWPRNVLAADHAGIRLQRAYEEELFLDADAIVDLSLGMDDVGNPQVEVGLRHGDNRVLIRGEDPPGLALLLLPELRRVLHVDPSPGPSP